MNSPRSPQTPLSYELKAIINNRNVLSMRSRMKGITYASRVRRFVFIYKSLYVYAVLPVLNSLNESNQKHFEEKEKNLRSRAVQEILTTELTYLRQLEILMEVLAICLYTCPIMSETLLCVINILSVFHTAHVQKEIIRSHSAFDIIREYKNFVQCQRRIGERIKTRSAKYIWCIS